MTDSTFPDCFTLGRELMRSMDRETRHMHGAEYTPRAYVERLIAQVLAPVLEEWELTERYVAALECTYRGEARARALELVEDFHRRLCAYTVLDPAAGSGNILVVALEAFADLELAAAVWLLWLGASAESLARGIELSQFKGIEIDPRTHLACRVSVRLAWLRSRMRRDALKVAIS